MTGLLAAAALLLLAAGLPKVVDPRAGAGALRAARLPGGSTAALVRLAGLAEVAVAILVLTVGGRLAGAAVAVTYAALATFALRLARVAPEQPCGCFGSGDRSPVTGWHVGTDLALAAAGVAALVRPGRSLLAETAAQPLLGLPFLALVGALAFAAYLLMTALPDLRRLGAAA